MALRDLGRRFGATAHEIAAWVFHGPSLGGLAAFVNANELDPPPRFSYAALMHWERDYLSPLMHTWFETHDLAAFVPAERYITGCALVERWSALPGLIPEAFIRAKIHESRLNDLHPILGLTQGSMEEPILPPLEEGLFALSEVRTIEREDFGEVLDSAEIATATAGSAKPAPAIATARAEGESPIERSQRLLDRKRELKAAGSKKFLQQIASEERLSISRVKELIKRAAGQAPFHGLGKTVSGPRSR